ncbi:copper-binding protein [Pseudomonas veronii]|jgi:Cu(I)/Ag(I) efflux system protein CusF|uniref:copper-binding protein n=1 Tax=Pseudomonas veronii TaxID=76761 RepID=UPI000F81CC34|nr:copper-binding protein [Pseudomonas veronii]NMX51255.1 copper-binding protein [Pseudomonas veronii]RTY59484.1 copper-binding protein [Pseudomonas veronii]
MKLTLIAVASTIVTLSFSAMAEDMPGMKMDGMEGMQMKQESKQTPVANAEGTIKAIDPAKHTVTLAHGAVPAVQWPPMTMAFSVAEDQLAGLSVGDRVSFSFRLEGGKATIVSIKK